MNKHSNIVTKSVMLLSLTALLLMFLTTSCVKGKKSCKANHKKVQQMRKSGQIKM